MTPKKSRISRSMWVCSVSILIVHVQGRIWLFLVSFVVQRMSMNLLCSEKVDDATGKKEAGRWRWGKAGRCSQTGGWQDGRTNKRCSWTKCSRHRQHSSTTCRCKGRYRGRSSGRNENGRTSCNTFRAGQQCGGAIWRSSDFATSWGSWDTSGTGESWRTGNDDNNDGARTQ